MPICPDTMITTEWPRQGVMAATDDGLRLFYDVSGAVMVQPLDGAGRFVGEPQRLDGAPAFRTVTIAGDLYVFEHEDELTAFTRDGKRAWKTDIPHEGTVPWAVVAYRGDELGVFWDQQMPTSVPGYTETFPWFMRLGLDGQPISEPVQLPGVDAAHAGFLGYYPTNSVLVVDGEYVATWQKVGLADTEHDREMVQTRIGREMTTTLLARENGITHSATQAGDIAVVAWGTYNEGSFSTSAWIRDRRRTSIVTLAENAGAPSVGIDGSRLMVVWDATDSLQPMVLDTIDPKTATVVSRKPLRFERPEGSWQASRGLFVTECGVVVPFMDVVDSADADWATIYVPR